MMYETIEKFKREVEESKEICMNLMMKNVDITNISTDEFKAIRTMMSLTDIAMRLTIEEAEAINRIEGKLDRLLSKE